MKAPISFVKFHGLGNDFILLDGRKEALPNHVIQTKSIRWFCDRRFGIGADGVILILPSRNSTARIRIFNSDGSESDSCGNGFRCVAKFLWEHPIATSSAMDMHENSAELVFESAMGLMVCRLTLDSVTNKVLNVEISMGTPRTLKEEIPMLGSPKEQAKPETIYAKGKSFVVAPVSMGNPHAVIYVNDNQESCLHFAKTYGPLIEQDQLFPSRVNVGFARKMGPQNLELVVWERGCGLTQACGTGACAAVVVGCRQGLFEWGERVTVHLPGGELEVTVLAEEKNVLLRGTATEVYSGTISFS